MKSPRLRASLALVATVALGAGLVTGTAGTAEAKALKPATSFTMQPDGSSGKTDKGSQIPNIDSVKATIRTYYGATKGQDPANPGKTIYLPNLSTSPYATEVEGIENKILATLPNPAPANTAVVFDVDSTLLSDYANEEEMNFNYSPSLNAAWVTGHLFPAVPGMPALVKTLYTEGYAIFGITGRPNTQEDDTIANLTQQGFTTDGTSTGPAIFNTSNLFTKPNPSAVPAYLTCGTTCTTVQFKSLTRQYIQTNTGDTIAANIGDQWSDLQGGTPAASGDYKIPNPTYYLPSGTTTVPGLSPNTTFTMKPDGSSGKTVGGENIPNLDSVKATIRAYYNATNGIANKATSPYISEMKALAKKWKKKLATSCQKASHRHQRPAAVFDVDDTTLWTYDMEDGAMGFNFDPALQNQWVQGKKFPAVPGMTKVVKKAKKAGCTIVGLTGRTKNQGKATLKNLKKVGYKGFTKRNLFLKPNTGKKYPKYIGCKKTCTTVQYKLGTRKYLEKTRHYTIVANFGDQFSDLKGGHAKKKIKLPNPTYYLP
jgi:predicted secreted acid phosphatase